MTGQEGQTRDGRPRGGVLEVNADLKESSLLFREPRSSLLEVQVIMVVAVQPLSRVRLFENPCTAAHQAPLSFTISWSLLKLMSTESVILSNHLTLCCPLLLLTPVFPSNRVFSNEWIQCNHMSPYQKEAGGSESDKER